MFPVVSETFILNEIVESLRQGVEVRVYSELKPSAICTHAKLKEIHDRIEYLPSLESVKFLETVILHAQFFIRRPFTYIRALKYALRHRRDITFWTFKVCVHYAEKLRRFKPDILHTHFASDTARFTHLISRLLGISYTVTVHGWHDLYKVPPKDLRDLVMNSFKTITVCEYNRSYMEQEYDIPPGRIKVVKCGISLDTFRPGEADEKEAGLVLSVGRLHYHKAYHHLIDACKILIERGVDVRCWIIGDGDLRTDLQKRIDRYTLGDRVVLLGMKSNEEVAVYLRKASVFALSSDVEIVPIVYMEAMASQLPLVATDVFGVPELVEHGKTGLLCKTGDPKCMADRMQYLLDHCNERRAMGIRGREKVRKDHEIAVQAAKLISLWTSAIYM